MCKSAVSRHGGCSKVLAEWRVILQALRAMLGSGNTSEDRLQQHGHGRMLMRPSASFGSDSACYTGLGTALEKVNNVARPSLGIGYHSWVIYRC